MVSAHNSFSLPAPGATSSPKLIVLTQNSASDKEETCSMMNLKLEGSLSDILVMKSHYPEPRIPCYKWVSEKDTMKAAETARV